MNKRLVIFGLGTLAELMFEYFSQDSDYEVVAFSVDAAYVAEAERFGVPVIPYEELAQHHPPNTCKMFVATSYDDFNRTRRRILDRVTRDGFALANYISSRAAVFTQDIGTNVVVGEFATVQPFSSVADNVFVWPYTIIGHHSNVGADCYLGPLAFIGASTHMGVGCVVGPGAVLGTRRSIGDRTFVGSQCRIFKDSPGGAIFLEPGSQAGPYTVDTIPEVSKIRLFQP